MKAPRTYFSTELHTGRTAVRRRLEGLFTVPRRRGVLPLVCILLLVSMLGSLVACDTAPASTSPVPAPTESAGPAGQVWEGVDVPDAVLSAAESYVWGQYRYWSENSGAVGMVDGEMKMIGQPAQYDDWRIESMEPVYHYDELEGVALDVYRLGWRLHTTTPDQVLLAGGMEMDEEGWVLATYPNSTYLIFDVGTEEPVYLFSSMVNDCEPGSELFTETIRRPLQWALLQDEAESTALEYLRGQHPDQEVQLASLTFQQETTAPPQTVCAVYEVDYLVDMDGKWVSMPLNLADGERCYLVLAYTGEGCKILGGFNARPGTYSRQAEALSWGLSDTDFALLWQGGGWYGLGGSASHLIHVLGEPEITNISEGAVSYQPGDRWERWSWPDLTLECYASPEGETSIWTMETSHSGFRTNRGILICSSTREDVLRAYPTASDQPNWDIEGDFLWFGPEDGGFGHYLIFYFDGGDTVRRVQLTDYFD
ncbi:hypothetical protein [uncultured Intestinimonas sp.]|uniref:hypothetical protein n=1 Tax=uncultured Intestinimonas sp. TaxID=1689265 RepID=UPI0025EFC124|nr:hypothetical protein [uncultured Intestinimonas sp.]